MAVMIAAVAHPKFIDLGVYRLGEDIPLPSSTILLVQAQVLQPLPVLPSQELEVPLVDCSQSM